MKRLAHFFVLASLPALLAGCLLLNDVTPLPSSIDPGEESTLVLFGIRIDGAWGAPKFAQTLVEYDYSKQKMTGNCWRFNHIEAIADPKIVTVQYFAFVVPPGHYRVGSSSATFPSAQNTFVVPKGQFVYLGDFVYSKAQVVELHHDLDSAQHFVRAHWPSVNKTLVPTKTVFSTATLELFLCMP